MAEDIDNMLEAKRQLLLGISHELRSPLTRSKVHLALLPESSAHLEIAKDIEMMEQLITELLESERLNSQHATLQPETTDLEQLISGLIEKNFDTSSITQKLERIEASVDIARLKLLISNLLQNAIIHNGKNQPPPGIYLTSDSSSGKQGFQITVEDFGKGIAKEHIPFLTEPFYRADPSRQRKTGGYGLGLYLCRMILQAHGGTLNIESKEEEGTRVICKFPQLTTFPNQASIDK
ncbi:MAG: hypothetical protein GKR96_07285 [Gammaproteobacteria bacterium]|nr:hypothetical protein [Gammaproteobacteria bacterium]